MSHHLDSPAALANNRLDIDDLYVFRGEVGTVLVMDVNNTTAGPDAPDPADRERVAGQQGFHPQGRYEFLIDLDGDAVADITYRLTFGERDGAGEQTVELRAVTGAGAPGHEADGTVIAHGVTDSLIAGERGIRLWAGRADDPFYTDYTALAEVGTALTGAEVDLSGWRPDGAINRFAGNHIHTIVLEVPDEVFGPAGRIGVWATTALATDAGGWRVINRVGHPFMTLLYPGSADEHYQGEPADDLTSDSDRIAKMIASVVAANGTAEDPDAYGRTVAGLLLPDILRYEIGTPASSGFAGRNGRTLTDNVADVKFSLLTNSALSVGLGKQDATGTVIKQFPYLIAAAG